MSIAKRQLEMSFGRGRRYAFDRRVPAQSAKSQSYDALNASGMLLKRKQDVLDFLRDRGADGGTQQQFAKAHRLEINCVTAAFRELETERKIRKCEKVPNPETRRPNTIYRLN